MQNKIQPSYDSNRQILGKVFPLSTPFNVIIDTSEVCQFRCDYCFRSDNDKRKWGYAKSNQLMSWDLFCHVIAQIKLFPEEVKQISLSNHGEPLCNRKLPDMVRYIKEEGIGSRVSIHTNAALLDEKYAKELADSRIDKIVVSVQGLSAQKYKEVCGIELNFEEFYHNLQILYKNKTTTQINIKIANTALDEGEKELFYDRFSAIADRVFVEQVVPIWKDVELKADRQKAMNKYGEMFEKQECCPLIFHTLVVSPEGDVYPCTQLLTPYVLGSVKDSTLVELWNSKLRRDLLIRQCEGTTPDICKNCYIGQNSIYAKEDMIDAYREEILQRIKES